MLIVESDSANVVAWVSHSGSRLWRFQFYLLKEIMELPFHLHVVFCHEIRSANSMANALAK